MCVDHDKGDEGRVLFEQLCCTERLENRKAGPRNNPIEELAWVLLQSLNQSPEEAYRILLDRVAKEFVAEVAGILIRESTEGKIRSRWRVGVGSLAGLEHDWMAIDECPCSLVLPCEQAQLFCGNERSDFFSKKVPIRFCEALAFPVVWENDEPGALWLIRQNNRTPFDQGDVRRLSILADLFHAVRQTAQPLRCLEELVPPRPDSLSVREWLDELLRQVLRIVAAESASLYLQDSAGKEMVLIAHQDSPTRGSAGQALPSVKQRVLELAIERREAVLVEDVDDLEGDRIGKGVNSEVAVRGKFDLAVPLFGMEGEVVGVLSVCMRSSLRLDSSEFLRVNWIVRLMTPWIGMGRMHDLAQRNERRFQFLARSLGAVTWTNASSQEVPQPYWIACTGPSSDQMSGEEWRKVVHPEDLPVAMTKWNASVERGVPFFSEHRTLGRDQQWHWSSVHAVPVRTDDGTIQEWIGFCFDITSHRQSDFAAQESQAKLTAAMENMSDALLITDEEGNPMQFNQAFVEFHRFPSRSAVFPKLKDYGSVFQATTLEGEAVGLDDWAIIRALRGERVREAEYMIRRTDTGESWIGSYSVSPIFDRQQKVLGCVAVARDITSRKQFERELEDRETMLRAILNTASDAILVFDRKEHILAINPGCQKMFGYGSQELIGGIAAILLPSAVRSSVGHSFRRYLQKVALRRKGGLQEAMMMRRDGEQFPAEISLVGIAGDERFAVFIRDITERRELQRRILRAATDEQRRIGQELHDGIQQELTGLALFASAVRNAIEQIGGSENPVTTAPSAPSTTTENPRLAKLQTISQKLTEGLADAQKHVQALARGILASPVRADELPEALKKLTETAGTEISFELDGNGTCGISDDNAASHLYRIAQEAINNAIRHGKASRIKVLLQALQDQVRLEVSDNGNGFHPSTNGDGVGLRTMEYRVQLMNGVLQIEPMPEGGTTIRCILPVGRNDYEQNRNEINSSRSTLPPENSDGAFE
jgi:PAS domain S-box-containing protein